MYGTDAYYVPGIRYAVGEWSKSKVESAAVRVDMCFRLDMFPRRCSRSGT